MATLSIRSDLTVETAAAAVSRATGVPCVLAPELPAAAGRALLGNLAADNIAAASLLNKCLAAAETAGRGQRYRWELVDGRVVIGASVETKPDARLVRVYNLEHLIPFRRAEDSDAGSSSIPLGREATDPGGEQLFALMAQIEHDIEPEGWMDNGGDEGHMASLRPRLLIVYAWPRTHLAIERLLAEWKPVAPEGGAIGG